MVLISFSCIWDQMISEDFCSSVSLLGMFFALLPQHYNWFSAVFSLFSSVQLLSHVRLFANPWTAVCQASLSITNSQSLLKLRSIESAMPSNHLIFFRPLLLLPSIFPSIKVFSNESAHHHPINTAWRSKHGQLAQPHPWHQRKRQACSLNRELGIFLKSWRDHRKTSYTWAGLWLPGREQ